MWKTVKNLSWDEVQRRALRIAEEIDLIPHDDNCPLKLYGIPQGGIYAAQAVFIAYLGKGNACLVEEPDVDCIFIDDVIDIGKTRDKFISEYENPDLPFFALVNKTEEEALKNNWISFPWERMNLEQGIENNIIRIIQYIGDDPEREGLKETPNRVIRSFEKLYGGYKQKPADVIKVFENDGCDEMVLFKNIEFYSTCEHHMLPFYGKAHIAYIPNKKIIGVSKLARILEIYARRLQIQERLCQQVTEVIDNMIKPKGSACILEAWHFCIAGRGVEKQNSILVTSSLTGAFKESVKTRSELMKLIKGD